MDEDRQKAVTSADATGMIAGEELITQAETFLPLQEGVEKAPAKRPTLPRNDLHDALPEDHAAHETIDRLHGEIEGDSPDREAIEKHVGVLRSLPELEAIVANWWDDPQTQRYVATLTQIGL